MPAARSILLCFFLGFLRFVLLYLGMLNRHILDLDGYKLAVLTTVFENLLRGLGMDVKLDYRIGLECYYRVTDLLEVSLERLDLSTIDSIGEYAFAGCKKLVGYTLKDGAVCAENSFEGAGKATVGCGAIVGGIAPVTVVIAAAFVLLKRKYN